MKRSILISIIFSIVLVPSSPFGNSLGYLDNLALLGVGISGHNRSALLDFGNNHTQNIDKRDATTFGVMVGKRWGINRAVRLQLSGNFNFGSWADDTLDAIADESGNQISTVVNMDLFYGGIVGEVQFPFTVSPDGSFYLALGGGAHGAYSKEYETVVGSPSTVVNDPYLETHFTFSGSVHAGVGFEILISRSLGVALTYNARYWNPIAYPMSRDLFPYQKVDYREQFISHEVYFNIIVRRR